MPHKQRHSLRKPRSDACWNCVQSNDFITMLLYFTNNPIAKKHQIANGKTYKSALKKKKKIIKPIKVTS